jgi:hypothetical protein
MRFCPVTTAFALLISLATANRAYAQVPPKTNAPIAQGRRGITETDLFNFVWITDPQLSPDGSRVAFHAGHCQRNDDGNNSVPF